MLAEDLTINRSIDFREFFLEGGISAHAPADSPSPTKEESMHGKQNIVELEKDCPNTQGTLMYL